MCGHPRRTGRAGRQSGTLTQGVPPYVSRVTVGTPFRRPWSSRVGAPSSGTCGSHSQPSRCPCLGPFLLLSRTVRDGRTPACLVSLSGYSMTTGHTGTQVAPTVSERWSCPGVRRTSGLGTGGGVRGSCGGRNSRTWVVEDDGVPDLVGGQRRPVGRMDQLGERAVCHGRGSRRS